MFSCLCCGETFSVPKAEREIHYECEEHPYEIFYVCPYCLGMEIEEEEIL